MYVAKKVLKILKDLSTSANKTKPTPVRRSEEGGTKSKSNTEVIYCKPSPRCRTQKTLLSTVNLHSPPTPNLDMAMNRPTILLAHGAWHPPHLYDPLKEALSSRGYDLIAPALPTMGTTSTGVGWHPDFTRLLDTAEPLFSQGEEVLLLAHSYGGIPAAVATRDNSVAERAKRGLRGGFRQIVFLCAFAILAAGSSELDTVPNKQWPDWQTVIETDELVRLLMHLFPLGSRRLTNLRLAPTLRQREVQRVFVQRPVSGDG